MSSETIATTRSVPKKPQPHPDPEDDDDGGFHQGTPRNNNNDNDNDSNIIHTPRETDVLCGRGGRALRHPGNQIYRRLVALNKAKYTTCLKAEKLKISKSIVAAVRESDGRFLEKKAKTGTWCDIGDKKAVEKTSQALREGQPQLRKEIEERGGGAVGAQAVLESQIELEQQLTMERQRLAQQQQQEMAAEMASMEDSTATLPTANLMQQNVSSMQNVQYDLGPTRGVRRDVSSELVRLGLGSSTVDSGGHEEQGEEPSPLRLIPSLVKRGSVAGDELGMGMSTLSLMSEFSNFGMDDVSSVEEKQHHDQFVAMMVATPASSPSVGQFSTATNNYSNNMAPPMMTSTQTQSTTSTISSSSSIRPDRRKMFKETKYTNLESARTATSDGMPDIYYVESSPSLLSNMSMVGDQVRQAELDALRMAANNNNNAMMDSSPAAGADVFGGSRRSVMSEVSRVDDQAEVQSIFSDLSRKIGNVSTRSFPMSDISLTDEQEELLAEPLPPKKLPSLTMDFD